LHLHPVPVVPKALIIGGGIAGMTAALSLAKQGLAAYLVEREPQLGGNLTNLYTTVDGINLQWLLEESIAKVRENPLIQVFTNGEVGEFAGHQGHFYTTIYQAKTPGSPIRSTHQVEHGVVIVATGGKEQPADPHFKYGENDQIITGTQLEAMIATNTGKLNTAKSLVFIQCASAGEEEILKYCSRTCCIQSIKNAIQVKKQSPHTQVVILYRDIRTYGFYEKYYKEARELGMLFVRYSGGQRPVVESTPQGTLRLQVVDPDCQLNLTFEPDYLVLATGTGAADQADKLGSMLKVPRNEDGFFVETHAKLGPMDFPSAGIFLCGVAHAPKTVAESIFQAQGAVARACTILAQPNLMIGGVVAGVVRPERCAACLTCVRVCPYSVPKVNRDMVAEIDAVQCHGCGTCVGECPGKAIQLEHYRDDQLLAKIQGLN
jgi:heterodisulfide reductase subunit A-like polyferredoxin